MYREDIKAFVKDLFTMRTVWIDRGGGKWTVKKKFHPLLRSAFWVIAVIVSAGVYSSLNNPHNSEAVAKSSHPDIKTQSIVMTASLPEPETITPPVQTEKPQQVVIPLKATSRKRSDIVFPSDANPETDRIITQSVTPQPVNPQPVKPKILNDGSYNIDVNKSTYTLTLYKGNEVVKEYPIAIGKNPGDKQRIGDNRTPVGNFRVVSIENASGWSHDFRDGKGKIRGAYGPWFLRLDAKGWKGIGIHGTHDPDSRGTNATEGCIRLSNEDIAELKQYAYKNMPVTIREN